MKIFHSRKQFLVFFMPGFLLGIVYVNFIARQYMAEPGIFSDFFLNQFQSVSIDAREYIWYLLRLRAVPFLALAGLSLTKAGKVSAVLFLVWTGISAGILISAAVLGDQGQSPVSCGIVSPVPALYPGVCSSFVVLLYGSADSLEPSENDLCIPRDVSWDPVGNLHKSDNRKGVPLRAVTGPQHGVFVYTGS